MHKAPKVMPAQPVHKVQQVKLVPLAQPAHKAQQVQREPLGQLVRKALLVQLVQQVHKGRRELV